MILPKGGMGGARVASMEFLAIRLHEIPGNRLPNRILPTGGMGGARVVDVISNHLVLQEIPRD